MKVGDQVKALEAGVDIVVATPGRLEDLIQQKSLSLTQCRFFILDEADGLLKAGYEKLINIDRIQRLHKLLDTHSKLFGGDFVLSIRPE